MSFGLGSENHPIRINAEELFKDFKLPRFIKFRSSWNFYEDGSERYIVEWLGTDVSCEISEHFIYVPNEKGEMQAHGCKEVIHVRNRLTALLQ